MAWVPRIKDPLGSMQVTENGALGVNPVAEAQVIGVPPSKNETVPVGASSAPEPGDTVAVYVTGTPTWEGLPALPDPALVTLMVEEACTTTWVRVSVGRLVGW